MAGFQPAITINEAMQRIRNSEYLIPAFQRKYVWKSEQIEKLFDSLMKGYPISSMLFWSVKDESKTAWKFYRFLDYYREKYHTHNELFNTSNHKDFFAILDGQQRLTSLYLALFGHYDMRKKGARKNDDRNFQICDFYFNLTQSQKPEDGDVEYEFLWFDRKETNSEIIFIDKFQQKWFKCSCIYNLIESYELMKFANEKLMEEEFKRLSEFHTLIFNTKNESRINFYLEEEQNPDKAVNIFIRINSGGTKLDYSDILFSFMIANCNKIDARTEIENLVDTINQDFEISKDLILKGFLYLFHNNIKFQINSFDKKFVEQIEEKWENIKNTFIDAFNLIKSFGFNGEILSSNNAILPIVYFIYHKNISQNIKDSVGQKENRDLIKKWLLRVIILQPFGGSGDSVLASMRRAFIKDFAQGSEKYFDDDLKLFPLEKIEKMANYTQTIDDEFLEDNVIYARKNSPQAFAVLALLYPNLDYKNNNFHRDHLHPQTAYEKYEKATRDLHKDDPEYEPFSFAEYDSLPNLQMLDANENSSKNDKTLEEWVVENCGKNREKFLEAHLIPNVDLSLEKFDEFFEVRKTLFMNKLKKILN